MTEALTRFTLPDEFTPLIGELLYKPDRNRGETKALEAACAATGLSAPHLLLRCGAIRSPYDYHRQRFLRDYFPRGTGFPETSAPEAPADLPRAEVAAFSIDDAATTTTDTINITTPTTAQMEETMLHANASVTPITPVMETQIKLDDALPETGEPHLFARQDKDAQKGTHLRGMIRDAIRQELQGEIGNRLSRNLQQMIRHEIELTLRQMCEQE